ncbi:MAG: hypothetical protein SFU83_12640 [Meiothermus sp.]|nr:hypothetical protein [Meiothermus sp.]
MKEILVVLSGLLGLAMARVLVFAFERRMLVVGSLPDPSVFYSLVGTVYNAAHRGTLTHSYRLEFRRPGRVPASRRIRPARDMYLSRGRNAGRLEWSSTSALTARSNTSIEVGR